MEGLWGTDAPHVNEGLGGELPQNKADTFSYSPQSHPAPNKINSKASRLRMSRHLIRRGESAGPQVRPTNPTTSPRTKKQKETKHNNVSCECHVSMFISQKSLLRKRRSVRPRCIWIYRYFSRTQQKESVDECGALSTASRQRICRWCTVDSIETESMSLMRYRQH